MTARSQGRQRDRAHSQAFTLVELLVVISIIAVLASMTLFALFGAQEDAREKKTRTTIRKIDEIIRKRWETYQTRPIQVATVDPATQQTHDLGLPPGTDPRFAASVRLAATRELMRMELPDRKTDLMDGRTILFTIPSGAHAGETIALAYEPAVWGGYIRRAQTQIVAYAPRRNPRPPGQPDWRDDGWWTPKFRAAECLYLIVASFNEQGSNGLERFGENEIGDVDDDGMHEILDAWGRPIRFLRWAPGYLPNSDIMANRTPDPFDPLKRDPRWFTSNTNDDPFALFPLIISSGRDKQLDIAVDFDPRLHSPPLAPLRYAALPLRNDPYIVAGGVGIGSPAGRNYLDNISNHTLEVDSQ